MGGGGVCTVIFMSTSSPTDLEWTARLDWRLTIENPSKICEQNPGRHKEGNQVVVIVVIFGVVVVVDPRTLPFFKVWLEYVE